MDADANRVSEIYYRKVSYDSISDCLQVVYRYQKPYCFFHFYTFVANTIKSGKQQTNKKN